jgi:hypothetical protein
MVVTQAEGVAAVTAAAGGAAVAVAVAVAVAAMAVAVAMAVVLTTRAHCRQVGKRRSTKRVISITSTTMSKSPLGRTRDRRKFRR